MIVPSPKAENPMTFASQTLAEFVTELTYERLPAPVIERARACMIDTIAVATYGVDLLWSKIVIAYARVHSAAKYVAKPSDSQRCAQSRSVTASPNHWCAVSCAINPSDIPFRRKIWSA